MQRTPSDRLGSLVLPLTLGLALARLLREAPLFDSSSTANSSFVALALVNGLCVVPAALAAWLPSPHRRLPWSLALFGALGVLASASMFWAADRFQAILSASNTLAALCLGYAVHRSLQRPAQMRWVTAFMAAVVVTLSLQSVMYLLVDRPILLEWWKENGAQQLAGFGAASGDAALLEGRIASRQLSGFFLTPNTLGTISAASAVLFAASAGSVLRREWRSAVCSFCLLALAFWMIAGSGARAAGAAALALSCVAAAFATGLVPGPWKRRTVLAGWILAGLGAVLVPTAGAAIDRSLHFRQAYWTAAARILADHPFGGVGWGNFGWFYPQYRLPGMPEEIKDPHNFLVRCGVELGVAGGLLGLAWLVVVLAKCSAALLQTTADDTSDPVAKDYQTPSLCVATAMVAGLLMTWLSRDWSAMARFGQLIAAGLGTMLAMERYGASAGARRRQIGLALAVAAILALAMLDVVVLEPGACAVLLLLVGAIEANLQPPATIEHKCRDGGRWIMAVLGILTLGLSAALWVGAPFRSGSHLAQAKSLIAAGGSRSAVLAAIADSERANPRNIEAKVLLGRIQIEAGDLAAAAEQYAAAVTLNPGDLLLRVTYADLLRRLGQDHAAREQIAAALAWNDQFPPGELRRLPPDLETALRKSLEQK